MDGRCLHPDPSTAFLTARPAPLFWATEPPCWGEVVLGWLRPRVVLGAPAGRQGRMAYFTAQPTHLLTSGGCTQKEHMAGLNRPCQP